MRRSNYQWIVLAGILALGALLAWAVAAGPWSPGARASARLDAEVAELAALRPFTFLDRAPDSLTPPGCSAVPVTFMLAGSALPPAETAQLFQSEAAKLGWQVLPDDRGGQVYFFRRSAGESLAYWAMPVGPHRWQARTDLTTYAAVFYLQVAAGANLFGWCDKF